MSKEKNIQSRSIKLYDDEWEEFKKIKEEMDGANVTDRTVFLKMMDFYKNPKTIKVDNPEHLSLIEQQNQELANLRQQLENSINEGNESAMSAQRLQMELDKAQEQIKALEEAAEHQTKAKANHPENVFEVEVHPVPFYFLKKMAEHISKEKKTEITPGYILTDLFLKDLQNPRANNLPYIVTTAEISKVLEEYRKAHPEEK